MPKMLNHKNDSVFVKQKRSNIEFDQSVLTSEFFDHKRPNMPTVKFNEWRDDLLSKVDGEAEPREMSFFDPSACLEEF